MASLTATVVFFFLLLQASTLVSSVLQPAHREQLTPSQLRLRALQPEAVRYSNDWAVQIQGNVESVSTVASSHGFINMGKIGNLEGYYHFQLNMSHEAHQGRSLKTLASRSIGSLSEMLESPDITSALGQHDGVSYVKQQVLLERVKRYYSPPTDPDWSHQWSLLNDWSYTDGPNGDDLNVEPAWMQGLTGRNVVVAVVDNGLEKTHEDLSGNFDYDASYDFIHEDKDPTPENYYGDDPDSHGTMCAGVIGMVSNNAYCGAGVAYQANVGGIKFDLQAGTDVTEARMLSYKDNHIQIYSNSWGPADTGFIVGGPGELATKNFEQQTAKGRHGKGSIYVWASGNGGWSHDSCAADGYTSSIYTIAVGSADEMGRQAGYDETCPGKMAVTFSFNSQTFDVPGDEPYNQVSTTTLDGACTDSFTGTSSSAPLLSGTIALVLQANSDLTWRDVQYLIVYTSNKNRLIDGVWFTNGGGLRVSPKFGFGAVDAEAMVTRARRWINVPTQQSMVVNPAVSSGTAWEANDIMTTLKVSSDNILFLEHVIVTMSLELNSYGRGYDYEDYEAEAEIADRDDLDRWLQDPHPKRGDIQITLTSPSGTTSTLLPYQLYDFVNKKGYIDWPFMSVHFWSEDPRGNWILRVTFRSSSGKVNMKDLSMTLYGTATTPKAVSNIPSQCDSACEGACSGPGPENCDICVEKRIADTQECVSSCPKGTPSYKNYCFKQDYFLYIIGGSVGGVVILIIVLIIIAATVSRCRRRKRGSYEFQRLPATDVRPANV